MAELAIHELLDDKYRVVRLVGQGAWATVYEAINVRIQRRVAIKVLNIELAARPELLSRFNREAEAATQIESPFVVTMFDAGRLPDGRPYIVMEFLEGEDLGRRLSRTGPLQPEQAVSYAIHLLSGLADAHATGILHRDIKPDNLVIVKSRTGEEILKLVDFGISKHSIIRPGELAMTQADVVLGSPIYMSPEQTRGARHMDHRSDLYSVGVVLYEAVTKQLPHEAESFNELMFKVALEDPADPRTKKPDLDEALAIIILKAISRDPDKRFQTAIDFRDVLIAWADQRVSQPGSPFVTTSKIRIRSVESSGRFTADNGSGISAHPGTPLPSPVALTTSPVLGPAPSETPLALTPTPGLPSPPPGSPPPGPPPPRGLLPPGSSPPPPIAPSRPRALLPLAAAGLLLLGTVAAFVFFRVVPTRPSDPKPPATAATSGGMGSAPVLAATPVASATETVAATSSAPPASSPAAAPPRPTPHPVVPGPVRTSTVPTPSFASSKPSANARPSGSPPPASSATVVEGRSVRTTY